MVFLEDDSDDFREIPGTRRNFWNEFLKVCEASVKLQSHSKLSQENLEHCLLIVVTEFKLSEAILAGAFVVLRSIWRLVFSFVTFQISTMNVYMLVCIYYSFRNWKSTLQIASAWKCHSTCSSLTFNIKTSVRHSYEST